ncbi:hypothetical protein C0W80_16105 [Photobacterium leiognathi subsp. mandapamensis]|uniref:hypothetical protein n=1 Tax=Photobacterium leiognathi TaxID=553611 RepID=UPI000D16F2EB|nr:hypothetical protein [Photobacterium leiognathi]PSU97847.1 hypothetical protein C0W80_16105 [Photobacterium leiognathi subsp. mandapamensis]
MQNEKITDEDYQRHWDLLWNAQLGIRYHMHMQNFYGKFGKFVTAFTLILSTSAGAAVMATTVEAAKIAAFSAAILQIIELVMDSKSKNSLHTVLRQRYINLETELSKFEYLTNIEAAKFNSIRAMIEVDEPPITNSVMTKCHNELVKVYKLDQSESQPITLLRKVFGVWYT